MSVFNEVKVLSTTTAINISNNNNNNLSSDFLNRTSPTNSLKTSTSPSAIISSFVDNNGGETPTTPVADNSNSSTPNTNSKVQQKNPKLYKTELCRSWMETGRCNYGERCQYAHGDREKRSVPRHPKYKTEPCQSYHKTGYCPYGPRCHFVHNENPTQLKSLINANEQALKMVQEIATTADSKQRTILTSSCSAASLGAYAAMQSNNSTNTPPIFGGDKMTTTNGVGLFPAQRSNSAIVAYLNGQQHLSGKSHGFGSNPDNFNIFNSNNMLLCQNSPPPLFDQQQQNCHQQYVNFDDAINSPMRNYNEANNNLKALWHETTGDVEFPQQNLNAPIMGIDNQNFRPKTLDLFSPPSAVEWHSEQISPLHFSSIPFIQDGNMTEIQQQNRRQRKILPVPLTTQKQHFLDFNDEIDCNNELDAQQLLGNLCCVSDDEYSRYSIISSNIDSGNESPPAASEDSTKAILTPCVLNIQQSNKIIRTSQHTSALTSLEETQQRRSSESDKTTIVPINSGTSPILSSSQPGPVVVEGINSTQARSCNKSTASSSLASILSSSSSNSATMALYPQSNVQKSAFLTNSNNKNTSPFNSQMPPLPPPSTTFSISQTTGTVTSMKEDTIIENKESTQPSVRLPVFERLFLNQ